MSYLLKLCAIPLIVALLFPLSAIASSQCYGSVSEGRIEDSVPLPGLGPNFSAYSTLAGLIGRTHVHSEVANIVLEAYAALEKSMPKTVFVYGETGWPWGGRFWPRRTHQNGLSVDFFVPVRNLNGESLALPTGLLKRFGYDNEFDLEGRNPEYTIDFKALAEHLYQLDVAAKKRNLGIDLVIFDTTYLPKLFATAHGDYLKTNLNFIKTQPWIRHDEHYQVDFKIPCKALKD